MAYRKSERTDYSMDTLRKGSNGSNKFNKVQ